MVCCPWAAPASPIARNPKAAVVHSSRPRGALQLLLLSGEALSIIGISLSLVVRRCHRLVIPVLESEGCGCDFCRLLRFDSMA